MVLKEVDLELTPEVYGQRVRWFREKLTELDAKHVAAALGKDEGYVSRLETATKFKRVDYPMAHRIAEIMGESASIPADDVFAYLMSGDRSILTDHISRVFGLALVPGKARADDGTKTRMGYFDFRLPDLRFRDPEARVPCSN